MEAELRYVCMSFGWYQELLEEAHLDDFPAAEAKLVEMLDRGGMIVHAYRETDTENPELVGRHARLCSFNAGDHGECSKSGKTPHEVERFLLDVASMDAWVMASETGGVVDERWSVVELWPVQGHDLPAMYGKARLVGGPSAGSATGRL
ncbi:MAG: hypothetical protein ACR2JE_12715 [Acidobacteriaceae bacterium]